MTVRSFYDTLAPWYHLIYPDWDGSIRRQASALHAVIQTHLAPATRRIWDAAAGIGTQAIGLTQHGYSVVASDLSEPAIHRAQWEAEHRHTQFPTVVADMRALPIRHDTVDLILACDNAVPHLLSNDAITDLFAEWHARLGPGGAFLISLRDYRSASPAGTEEVHEYGNRSGGDGTRVVLRQRWRWRPGRRYQLVFEFADAESGEIVAQPESDYYAIPPQEVAALARGAGFGDARVVDSDFFQPIVLGSVRA